jgi:putative phosphoribosyl transferase
MSVDHRIDLPDGTTLGAFIEGEPDVGTVIFAHGSGSSRHSRRNQHVARLLQDAGMRTVLMDLLTEEEEKVDVRTREHRFDIGLLATRVTGAIDWWRSDSPGSPEGSVGLFGASTGAAAALIAATQRPDEVGAVVSRGGRPDLAADALGSVKSPTLLIVGGLDTQVIELNESARSHIACESMIEIIPGASHLFEEPGALDQVADLATRWFTEHLTPAG